MKHISQILRKVLANSQHASMDKDHLDPEEKRSEHMRRVAWLESMRGAPNCCIQAMNMTVNGDIYHCNTCGREYEKVEGIMVCVG